MLGVKREDTIHVNGLPYHYKEEDLRLLFKDCGQVARIAIPEDRFSRQQNRGFAFVTFTDEKAARKALNLDGIRTGLRNPPLKIKIAEQAQDHHKKQNSTTVVPAVRREKQQRESGGRDRRQHERRKRSSSSSVGGKSNNEGKACKKRNKSRSRSRSRSPPRRT